ncbi:hypothetical protein [Halocola ammonii]
MKPPNREKYFEGKLSDYSPYVDTLSGVKRLKFWFNIWRDKRKAERKLKESINKGECFFGPFKGEFGHFLAHTAPFVGYLHSHGVKVHYCGMELHKPFLIDENGESLVTSYSSLRDFFGEVKPSANITSTPEDVTREIDRFKKKAEESDLPFWNIDDEYYYWFIHRNWITDNGYGETPNLEMTYKTRDENSAVIFARKKGAAKSSNNGEPWDYMRLARTISPFFDKVYLAGHPSLSDNTLKAEGNIQLSLSTDNRDILESCSNASLILTQHSGACFIGEYTNSQVLTIYKGDGPIGSVRNTLRFKDYIGQKYPLEFAFSEEEVVSFVEDFVKRRK